LGDMCQQMEVASRAGDGQMCRVLMAQVETAHANTLRIIRGLINVTPTSPSP
jgi:hypothetical protein